MGAMQNFELVKYRYESFIRIIEKYQVAHWNCFEYNSFHLAEDICFSYDFG